MNHTRKFTLRKHSGKLDEFSSSGLIWFDLKYMKTKFTYHEGPVRE